MLNFAFFRKPPEPELLRPVPTQFPTLSSAQIAVRYHGARIGGDFFDIVCVRNRMIFVVLDIAGKRDFAFHVAATVQIVFRRMAEELFQSEHVNEADALTQLVLAINRAIMEITGTAHMSTGFAGSYREELGTLCYVNAGYTPALVRDSHGISELSASGLPLGLFLHATQDALMTVLEPGAVLLLFSRGLMEARNRRSEFGIERVKKILANGHAHDAEGLCNEVLNSVLAHMHGRPIDNDLTTLALMRFAATAEAHA
ncbi:MAG: PP2C family protein-serine/threonine phosphatase [Terriglobia bacterium]|jgi:sigma-B regulation protein RsbU (phosphoserine phosphatase)|nr:PP2C family protein-serine/threonine phosphatase [Terriglobia bacterium]